MTVFATAVSVIGVEVPAAAAAPGQNLISNGALESGTSTSFNCFNSTGWGDGTVTFGVVAGRSGRAASITLSGRTTGDRKLLMAETAACAPAVTPQATYDLEVWYHATAPVSMTAFRHSAAGWTYWADFQMFPAVNAFTRAAVTTPPVPAGTDMIVWGLTLSADGTVVTDDYLMPEPGVPVPPVPQELVVNGTLESGSTPPDCFQTGGWGDATLTQGPDSDTRSGAGRSWRITLAGRTQGDFKLVPSQQTGCAPAVVPGQTYTGTVWYKSTAAANSFTVFKHDATGWSYWTDLKALGAVADWTQVSATLPAIPAGVDLITFGISISADGTLRTDDYSLVQGTVAPPAQPTGLAATGRWTVVQAPMPLRSIHSTLLANGKVLLVAGSGNVGANFLARDFRTSVWDPVTNVFTPVTTPEDFFCSGHVTLPDGRVLIMGGTKEFPGTGSPAATNFQGIRSSYVFDPATNAYAKLNDAQTGHWYPTLTKLETGDVWAAGGLNEQASGTVATELFDFASMRWLPPGDGVAQVPQTYAYWGTYPHMYLLDDNRLFYSGGHTFGNNVTGTGAKLYNWRTKQMWDVPGLRDKEQRDQAGSVLLPPAQDQKVLIVGGGHTEAGLPGVKTTDIVDLSLDNPGYVAGPDLPGPGKIYVNTLNLPDRTVLAANGATGNRNGDVLTAAVYNPVTNAWTSVAADPIGRNYHSSAQLLPDGRVAVFGSNPADNSFETRISIYEPPYLFKGTRPAIGSAPAQVAYGATFGVGVTGPITKLSLVSPGSATHQTDTNARLIDLPFTGTGASVTATVSANAALIPPGPYMLFAQNAAGAVSTAKWIVIR